MNGKNKLLTLPAATFVSGQAAMHEESWPPAVILHKPPVTRLADLQNKTPDNASPWLR